MRTILVTATEESTGKTAVALALALMATERGRSVGYMKPKGTRLRSAVGKTRDEDPMLARELLDLDAGMDQLEPVVYSETFVEEAIRGRETPAEVRERVRTAFDGLAEDKDLMVVEGGGRPSTGGVVDLTDAAVAELLDAEVLVLSGYGDARDVDDVLAAADDVRGRLLGVLFNGVGETAGSALDGEVAGFLEARDVPVLGVVPRDHELAGVEVATLADELGAEVLTAEAPTDATVERFTVGAMGPETALRYFRRTSEAAVVTGGDRSDVQTAALEAPGVRALVLTGGQRPSAAVLGTAEERGVPVVLVSADTLTTVERVEDVVQGGRTQEPATVRRMVELLATHADPDALLGERD